MNLSSRLLRISRIGFSISWLIVSLQFSSRQGFFTALPLFTLKVGAKTQNIGAILTIPLITGLTWLSGWSLAPSTRAWRWGKPTVTLPAFALGGLILLRSWPVHRLEVLAVSMLCVALFLGVYIYSLQNWPKSYLVGLFIVLAFIHGTTALIQFARQGPAGLRFFGEVFPLDPRIPGVSVVEVAGQRWLRAYGLTPHPNSLGWMMGLCLLLCLGTLLQNPRGRWWAWGASALAGIALFLSFSRSAWLGMALALLYIASVTRLWRRVPWHKKTVRLSIAVTLVVLVFIILAFGDMLAVRLWSLDSVLESNSIQERLRDFQQAWMLIRHQPLSGVGSGYYVDALWAWANATNQYFPAFQKVHNVPLLLAAEMGIAGPALWLWLVLAPPVKLAWQARKGAVKIEDAVWTAPFVLWFTVGLMHPSAHVLTFRAAVVLGTLCAIQAMPETSNRRIA